MLMTFEGCPINLRLEDTLAVIRSPAEDDNVERSSPPSAAVYWPELSLDDLRAMEVFPGVSMDPDVRFGKPCLTGTRIDVATIVGGIAAGETVETVAAEYALSVDQV